MLGELLTSASWPGGPQYLLVSMVPSSWYGDGHQPCFSTVGWGGSIIVCGDYVPGEDCLIRE